MLKKNPVKYGLLDKSGDKLPTPQHQEGYIVHLGDHDWVLSGIVAKNTVIYLKEIAKTDYNFSDKDLMVNYSMILEIILVHKFPSCICIISWLKMVLKMYAILFIK